jgi:hypothetical protein
MLLQSKKFSVESLAEPLLKQCRKNSRRPGAKNFKLFQADPIEARVLRKKSRTPLTQAFCPHLRGALFPFPKRKKVKF